jgi:hypothetical protein
MGQLIKITIEAEKLRNAPSFTSEKTGRKYFSLMVDVGDRVDQYGNHVSMYSEQTKEQREGKVPRHFVGNGKVIYGHGKIDANAPAQQESAPKKSAPKEDDLPF